MRFSVVVALLSVILATTATAESASAAQEQESIAMDKAKLLHEMQQLQLERNDIDNNPRNPSTDVQKDVIFQEAVEPDEETIAVAKKRHPETRQKVWERSPNSDVHKELIILDINNGEPAAYKRTEPKGDRTPSSDVHKTNLLPTQKEMHQERSPSTDLKKLPSVSKHDHVRNSSVVCL